MLIKNFYTIQRFKTGDNKTEALILLYPEHEVYQGHFPGQPVVPGVIQIEMIRELAEKALNRQLFINEVVSAKYLNMIIPDGKPLTFELSFKPVENGFSINGIIKNNDRVFSKVKMIVSIV
jgi:3-hydroxyacyl-[acyl-carrier-protein] dehydratase